MRLIRYHVDPDYIQLLLIHHIEGVFLRSLAKLIEIVG